MGVVINTNVDSIKIGNLLNKSTSALSTAMERMSSGLKINSARDDAAGTVIAAKMDVQLDGTQIAQQNVQNANSMMETTEGFLDEIQENIVRIRDLTLQAKNGTYSTEEVTAMNDEVQQRMQEIDRISNSSRYSSLKLFGDDSTTGLATNGATFQVGANGGADNTIIANANLFDSVTFSHLTGLASTFELNKSIDFDDTLTKLDNAVNNITSRKSILGCVGTRLDSVENTLETQYENLSSAKSVITDADIATEASNYTQASILQQVATSMLTQANQAPSIALSLV